jgi:hypothetical protein
MMHSFQNCDLPINLVHPRFGINTLFTNQFDSNLPSALPTTSPHRTTISKGMYLYAIRRRLTWFRPSPSQLDLSKLSFSQGLSKDVISKAYFAMGLCCSS